MKLLLSVALVALWASNAQAQDIQANRAFICESSNGVKKLLDSITMKTSFPEAEVFALKTDCKLASFFATVKGKPEPFINKNGDKFNILTFSFNAKDYYTWMLIAEGMGA